MVTVFVRKDIGNLRRLSMDSLPEVSTREVLSRGWAYDGKSWIRSVDLKDLYTVQVQHRDWLKSLGYDVDYK